METIFIYDRKTIDWGTTRLRGFSIANKLKCNIIPFDVNIVGKRIVCLKFNYFNLLDLTKRNEVILDMIDFKYIQRKEECEILKYFDYGIFASFAQKNELMHRFKYPEKCVVIYHHWDERLNSVNKENLSHVKIGYFGSAGKCNLYKLIPEIDYFVTDDYKKFDNSLKHYANYNVHYIIKPEKYERYYASLTKLATAAALFCPVISLKRCYEELLTDDYPFYCNSNSMEDVHNTIEIIKENYNNYKWSTAVNIMNAIKEKTSLDAAIKKYNEIIL